ncbi:DUF4123 domain-containing protein [Janthinobacterium lividum]|uniref:DUF4123 domain-containing protein n=1 Tax=Janthinobacterium lividum TaxID=29581 RepID=UPI0009B7EAD3|nr:DUF4123 domain-containing protein [Janthinobacterium lividum]
MESTVEVIVSQAWEAPLQLLHKQFHETANDRCLLWVNPAQGDPFSSHAIEQQRKIVVPIAHPRFDQQFAPYLIELALDEYAGAELFKMSVELAWNSWTKDSLWAGNGQAIAGWVISDEAPENIARHWASHCHIHSVQGLEKLLRFHDPGVREWLWPAMTVEQQRQMLGPVSSVIAFDRQQNLMRHGLDDTHALFPHAALEQRLILSSSQWAQVNDYSTLHAAWLTWGESGPKQWEQAIFSALARATHYGIVDKKDRELFALHVLQLGSDFHDDQRLQAVWSMTGAGEFYGGALEEVTGCPADQLQDYFSKKIR